jgi:hypothetical protein
MRQVELVGTNWCCEDVNDQRFVESREDLVTDVCGGRDERCGFIQALGERRQCDSINRTTDFYDSSDFTGPETPRHGTGKIDHEATKTHEGTKYLRSLISSCLRVLRTFVSNGVETSQISVISQISDHRFQGFLRFHRGKVGRKE